jgi:DNA replication protein DnaC
MGIEKHLAGQIRMTEDLIIRLPHDDYINEIILHHLIEYYEGLYIHYNENDILLMMDKIIEENRIKLIFDLEFYYRNPDLPLENVCSHLDNYNPQNQTQEELLKYARALIDLEDSHIASGLFIYGAPGVGKTHIAVGIAKEFMRRDITPNYVNLQPRYVSSYRHIISEDRSKHFVPGQAWIIDDLNSPFSTAMKIFKSIVLNTHDYGGRILATSNLSYDYLMENGFAADSGEKERFIDRMKGMFAVLQVEGDSRRGKAAWYNKI